MTHLVITSVFAYWRFNFLPHLFWRRKACFESALLAGDSFQFAIQAFVSFDDGAAVHNTMLIDDNRDDEPTVSTI